MFEEVDINGDGTMEWSEFLMFIIDQVESSSIQPYVDKVTGLYMSITEIVNNKADTVFKKFKESPIDQIADGSINRTQIRQAICCTYKKEKIIVSIYEKSNWINWYNQDM